MPRYSRSPSSKKSKKKSRTRSPSRSSSRYDYERSRDRSRDRHRTRDRSRDRHKKKKDRDSSRKRNKKHSRDRHRRSSSRSPSRAKDRSRSQSQTFIQERFNFSEAISVLDRTKDAVDEVNRNEFVPREFTSTASSTSKKLPDKVKIDLKNDTITLQKIDEEEPEDTLFNPKFFGDEDERMRRWIRKLLHHRQKQFINQ